MTAAIQAELPPELLAQARAFVEEGWAKDVNELLGLFSSHRLLVLDLRFCEFMLTPSPAE